jgi:hypothetical protein
LRRLEEGAENEHLSNQLMHFVPFEQVSLWFLPICHVMRICILCGICSSFFSILVAVFPDENRPPKRLHHRIARIDMLRVLWCLVLERRMQFGAGEELQ